MTDYEVDDYQAALAYLKSRPDADPRGIGFFGISKGAGAGLIAGARDPFVRCFVTDGIFATYTTMVPYMRQWVRIFSTPLLVAEGCCRSWYYGLIGRQGAAANQRTASLRVPHLEAALPRLAPRPLLMIHGGGDTYIKPEMARTLFKLRREPKEFWLVQGAKHNQALHVAGDEYATAMLEFFDAHLGDLA